ncbi:RdgB/HAM1 family non-canonical purine NTP pyrophosphatase [Pokkaliibacter sp. MBI-7]|uniref:dITP/XTP pyrophosphatase n=1 Tax=Proteobacteria bacterium 228 TaxID=2083153 RepID=A0A2S5KKC3_9PROT|nr:MULTISPECIES: RdgB/HAM1 family non-canonical purine NTP pyrophosphatase [Pokkaliibacter]MDH2432285.1 RdgB/HAM1 family non-canonical purine NTP pyrophosphatase [Pokkaliibacter sp. MBI-7]PPC75271.1 non-canonical purine NTP pyrophosphatase, RdgB/HAM1 family [Pokkaliibacter plantistimulans]
MKQIVLASGNKGKLREFNELLGGLDFEVIPQSAFSVPDADETGLSFVENAILKARHAARLTGLPALADDSGLEVDALKGAPGIYSARFAGVGASDDDNCELLLERLRHTPEDERSARFQCVLVFMRHETDPTPLICQGSWEGRVLFEARGEGGFGYDPLFWVPDQQCSAAELTAELKNRLSHRGKALQQLMQRFNP